MWQSLLYLTHYLSFPTLYQPCVSGWISLPFTQTSPRSVFFPFCFYITIFGIGSIKKKKSCLTRVDKGKKESEFWQVVQYCYKTVCSLWAIIETGIAHTHRPSVLAAQITNCWNAGSVCLHWDTVHTASAVFMDCLLVRDKGLGCMSKSAILCWWGVLVFRHVEYVISNMGVMEG